MSLEKLTINQIIDLQDELDLKLESISGLNISNLVNDSNFISSLSGHNATELDDIISSGSGSIITTEERNKLFGIAENANNYTHPENHSPSIITQDESNRFVTDIEKSTWNGKEDAILKNTAFNKNFGINSGDVCQGNDPRLSDSRIPLVHDINGLEHNGLEDAIEDNFVSFDASGKVKDSGSKASDFEIAGAASTAETNAKSYADGLASNYDPAGSASTAETNAKSYADGLASNYDPAGSAFTAETNAKSYADGILAANDAMVYKGVLDCSGNPNYPSANAGDTYKISAAGKIGGEFGNSVEIGDMAICLADDTAEGNQAIVGSYWNILQINLDGVVIGPSFCTNEAIVIFDQGTGKLIKNSLATIDSNGSVNIPLGQSFKINNLAITTANVADSSDKRYCTDAQKTVIGNTSNTNSGDETVTTLGGKINGADGKTTPVDADEIGLSDSAASNVLKKLTWANIKATLKSYFDTLYQVTLTFGIANTNKVQIDSEDVVENDYAKFTDSGVKGQSYSEIKQDLSLDNVTNDAQVKKIASSTDNAVMRWDGTSGDTPQDSLITVDDNGSINIPDGQTYKINGSAHAHAESEITFTDITTNNVSTSKHGFVPKAPDDSQKYLDGTGGWTSLTLNKLDATAAPTTGDDTEDGYSVGSVWVDVTNDKAYICVDNTSTAAIWKFIGGDKIVARCTLSADQTSNFSAGNHIEFNTIEYTSGSGLSLSTGSGQANGIVTLPANKKFEILGGMWCVYSASNGWAEFQPRDNSDDSALNSYGSGAISWSNTKSLNQSLQPIFNAGVDTSGGSISIKIDLVGSGDLSEYDYRSTFLIIREI